jgi:hypothetical protein
MNDQWIKIILGYSYVIFLNFLVGKLVCKLWRNANMVRLSRYNIHTSLVGKIDSTIAFIIFYLLIVENGSNNFEGLMISLGGWLTLKTLPVVWKQKSSWVYPKVDSSIKEGSGGERYNIYLIGTSLNVLAALLGAFLSYSLKDISLYNFFRQFTDEIVLIGVFIATPLWILREISKIPPNPTDNEDSLRINK